MRLHPFRALHPPPRLASEVASPPYDVVSTAEARALGDANPRSFLHVVRPEIGLDDGVDVHGEAVYEAGAQTLRRFVREGSLVQDTDPAIWLYRLDMGAHSQVGFVGCAEVGDYEAGRIKRHEFTRPDKEDDRTRHVDTLGAHTGPVFLTCPESASLSATQERLSAREPTLDVTATGGVRHRLWRVVDEAALGEIATGFGALSAFYIADGHHRAASAWRVRDLRRQRAAHGDGAGPWDRFLVVVFPEDQLKILAYNRVVADLNGHSTEGLLQALERDFQVSGPGAPADPEERHSFGLYLDGAWRQLVARPHVVDESSAVACLDVAILQDRVLSPLLGIGDPRTDQRISFVGGIRGTDTLAERVDVGGGCAFAMYPTSITELLRVADTGEVMPPKSTWFEPKLASGLMVHPIDPI